MFAGALHTSGTYGKTNVWEAQVCGLLKHNEAEDGGFFAAGVQAQAPRSATLWTLDDERGKYDPGNLNV